MVNTEHNDQIIDRLVVLLADLNMVSKANIVQSDFFIQKIYSDYKPSFWSVSTSDSQYLEEQFDSFEAAQEALIEFLVETCAKEISIIENTIDNTAETVKNKLSILETIVTDQHYISVKE